MTASRSGKWIMTATATIGVFAVVLEGTILTVALPRIMADYAISQTVAQWLITGFLVAATSTLLLSAWCLERFGLRRTFVAALGLFSLASAGAAMGPSFGWLVAARVTQGAAMGLVQPLGMVMLMAAFQPHERGRGIGIYGLGVVLAPAIAPVVGGLMVDLWAWQAVFLVALPPALIAAVLGAVTLGGVWPPSGRRRLDVTGLGLLIAALTIGLWGLVRAPRSGWSDPWTLGALALGIAGALVFAAWERLSTAPLLDLATFRAGTVSAGFTASMMTGGGLYGSTFLIPLFLQQAGGLDASTAGFVLLPAGLAMAVTFPVGGNLADKAPAAVVAGFGAALFAGSCLLMTRVDVSVLGFGLFAAVMLGRVGLGLMMPPITASSLRPLPQSMVAQAAGAINFGRQLGGALGVGIASILVQLGSTLGNDGGGLGDAADPRAASEAGYRLAFLAIAVLFCAIALPLWRIHRAKEKAGEAPERAA